MKYVMVDISGKVPKYDIALCEAVSSSLVAENELILLAANIEPTNIQCNAKRLISLIPRKFQNSENKIKRSVKALEGIINYIYLLAFVLFTQPKVIHFQWLPFLEVSSIERIFLQLIKLVSPKSKFLLTVHNIYPHNSIESSRVKYKARFALVEKIFDKFILHLQISKTEFCHEFGIEESRCKVIPHGVFEPKDLKIKPYKRNEKLRLIMYGNQSYYKGTDILVDAIALLPKEIQNQVCTTIVGKISNDYLSLLQDKAKGLNINIIPEFVSDEKLNQMILDSDIIVLPYREISQSGVLLLALFFERPIICSDLPSFRETLSSISNDYFFESNNSKKLATLIEKYVCNFFDVDQYVEKLKSIKEMYLWPTIAKYYKEELE